MRHSDQCMGMILANAPTTRQRLGRRGMRLRLARRVFDGEGGVATEVQQGSAELEVRAT